MPRSPPGLQGALVAFGIPAAEGVGLVFDHRRIDVAGANGVDTDAARRQLAGERFGQQVDAALRCAIDRRPLAADNAGVRADVDDAAAGLLEMRDGIAAHEERAFEIDVDHVIPFALCRRLRWSLGPDASRIDQEVEAAIRIDGGVYGARAFRNLCDVGFNGVNGAA